MLLVLLVVVIAVLLSVIVILVEGNASLKAQYRAYVAAVNSVYDNNSNVIIGLQEQIEDLLAQRADDQEVIAKKDHHIGDLVNELGGYMLIKKGLERDLRIKEKEVEQARKHASQLFNK